MATQLFTTTDGKTARLVNPYDKGPEISSRINNDWIDFERSVQTYPIHSDKPIEAGEFEGELVWQYHTHRGWYDKNTPNTGTYEEWKSICTEITRIAVRPSVPVKGEEKGDGDLDISDEGIYKSELKEFEAANKRGYNSAIDDAVKVAKGLPYETPLLIDRLLKIKK